MYSVNELVSFKLFYKKFVEECKRVASILSTSQRHPDYAKLKNCTVWELSEYHKAEFLVWGYAFVVDMETGVETYLVVSFPYDFLSFDNEQLMDVVRKIDKQSDEARKWNIKVDYDYGQSTKQ